MIFPSPALHPVCIGCPISQSAGVVPDLAGQWRGFLARLPKEQLQPQKIDRATTSIDAPAASPDPRDDPANPDFPNRRPSVAPLSGLPGPGHLIERFAQLLVADDSDDDRWAMIEELRASGWTLDAVVLSLFVPAARRLGDYWLDDTATFVDVTVATQRLTSLIFELERLEAPHFPNYAGRIMLVSAPDDQHGFGIVVLSFFLRRAGWHVVSTIPGDARTVIERSRETHFDAIGFSVGHERSIEPLKSLVRATRSASRNPAVVIGVGGPAILGQPQRVREIGADFSSSDAAGLVTTLEELYPQHT